MYLFVLLLPVLRSRIVCGGVYSSNFIYSSHALTHGTACLFGLSVFHEIFCILRAFVMRQQ